MKNALCVLAVRHTASLAFGVWPVERGSQT